MITKGNTMNTQQAIARITRRLEQETLKPGARKTLEKRLEQLQNNPNKVNFTVKYSYNKGAPEPKIRDTLDAIEIKLKEEKDEAIRAQLQNFKAKLEEKLAKIQQQQDGPEGLIKRLAVLTKKIEVEKSGKKARLQQRKAMLQARLAEMQEKDATGTKKDEPVTELKTPSKPDGTGMVIQATAFPRLTQRLFNVQAKLNETTNERARAKLEQRKLALIAEMVRKEKEAEEKKNASSQKEEPEVVPNESDDDASEVSMQVEELAASPAAEAPTIVSAAGFPKLAKRLSNIDAKLKEADNDGARARLEKRKADVIALLKKKQAEKKENVAKKVSDAPRFPGLKKRIANIEAKIKVETNEARKNDLEKRKAALLIKLADEQSHNSCSQRLGLAQELLAGTQNEDRRTSLEERVVTLQQAVKQQNQQQKQGQPKTNAAQADDKKRENQKNRLIQMEQQARANNNEEALNRIALQQVYIGHYPDTAPHFVPVFAKKKHILVKRAALRSQAIEAAGFQDPVDWIAADMYERLPRDWTFDDELAMFGGQGTNTGPDAEVNKKNGGTNDPTPTSVSNPLESTFVGLKLQQVSDENKMDTEKDGWMEVEANDTGPATNTNANQKKGGRGKKKKQNNSG